MLELVSVWILLNISSSVLAPLYHFMDLFISVSVCFKKNNNKKLLTHNYWNFLNSYKCNKKYFTISGKVCIFCVKIALFLWKLLVFQFQKSLIVFSLPSSYQNVGFTSLLVWPKMVGSVISTHHYCRHLHVSDVGMVCNVLCVCEMREWRDWRLKYELMMKPSLVEGKS